MKLRNKIPGSFFLVSIAIAIFSTLISLTETNSKQLSINGAESASQLSNVLFHAVKYNNFQQLNFYIPNDEEIKILKMHSTDKNRLFFESLKSAEIQASLQAGFEKITREGIEKNINWASAELVDFKTRTCNLNIDGCNVTYTIEDQNQNQIIISYDAIKINEQWYVFQNLNLVSDKETISSSN